jgi:hypothetical protein
MLFHTQQYSPYLYTALSYSLTALFPTAVPTIFIFNNYPQLHCFSHTAVPTISIYSTFLQFNCRFPTAVLTISIYSMYQQLLRRFTKSSTHEIYIYYLPTVALLFHSKQYTPYLYTVRTDGCTAVSHRAVQNHIYINSIFPQLHCRFTHSRTQLIFICSTSPQFQCCFTHRNTHHTYLHYVTMVAMLFHVQE